MALANGLSLSTCETSPIFCSTIDKVEGQTVGKAELDSRKMRKKEGERGANLQPR